VTFFLEGSMRTVKAAPLFKGEGVPRFLAVDEECVLHLGRS
jgi:hypothetical protein